MELGALEGHDLVGEVAQGVLTLARGDVGGHRGDTIVATGTPEQVARVKRATPGGS